MRTHVSRLRPIATAALLLIVMTAGCQLADPPTVTQSPGPELATGATDTAEGEDGEGDAPDADGPSPGLSPNGPSSAPPAPSTGAPAVPRPTIERCATDQQRDIDEVIGGQLDAFANGDFAAALDFATPGFRGNFTPESFGSMITEGFPIPASATSHQLVACQVAGTEEVTVASVTVLVTGDGGNQTLQYGMQLMDDGWRIDGAVPVTEGDAPVI